MKKIAFGTLKGGTGKTCMAFNIAGELAAEGERCCVLDLDPQCNLTNRMGVDIAHEDILSTRDIFENRNIDPEKIIVKSPIEGLQNLDLMPGHIRLVETEPHLYSKAAKEQLLENFIEKNEDFFKQYSYVIADTNPSIGAINQNAFFMADSIILVSNSSYDSIMGLQLFMYLWGEYREDLRKEDNVKAIILNQLDMRTGISQNVESYIREYEELDKLLLKNNVNNRVAYQYAELSSQPVCNFKGTNSQEASEEIRKIVDELRGRGVL